MTSSIRCATCNNGYTSFTVTRDPDTGEETTKYGNFCCLWCVQKAGIQEADALEALRKTDPASVEEHVVKTPNGTLRYLTRRNNTVVDERTLDYKQHPVYLQMTASERKLVVDQEDFDWILTITPTQRQSEVMARSCGSPWHTLAPGR